VCSICRALLLLRTEENSSTPAQSMSLSAQSFLPASDWRYVRWPRPLTSIPTSWETVPLPYLVVVGYVFSVLVLKALIRKPVQSRLLSGFMLLHNLALSLGSAVMFTATAYAAVRRMQVCSGAL
jgi:hypothetical protein